MNRLKPILLFAVAAGFLLLTVPANHSEAEDAYFYARIAEQGVPAEMFHAHHLLYLPLMRSLFVVAESVGYSGRSLPLLIGFSMLSGALAVCLFAVLAGKKKTGVLFAAALLFSYGFWRYSTTAEIYIPVTALCLLALYCLRRAEEHLLFFCGCALSAAAALLLHVISWPLVLVAIPFYFIATRRPGRAALYLTAVLSIAAVGYILAIAGPGLTVFPDAGVFRDSWISPRTWPKAAAAFGQNVVSANFLFAIEPVARKLQALFPYHMLQEELFMGKAAPGWIRYAAPVSLVCAVSAVLSVLVLSLKNLRRVFTQKDWAWPVAVLLWLGGTAATALLFEPANPEIWICSLAPFWLLLALCFRPFPAESRASLAAGVLAVVLLLHNLIGGIVPVSGRGGDYCRQKAAGLLERAQAGDLILTADSHAFITYLSYYTPATVVDAKFISPEQWRLLKEQTTGRIFVLEDVVHPLPPVLRRSSESVRQIQQTVQMLRPRLSPVTEDAMGTLFEWK